MTIELPYKPKIQEITTDALSDFYATISQIINFYQESLMIYSITRDSILPKSIPKRVGKANGYREFSIPEIQIKERNDFHSGIYPVRLFQNTIVNIASCYEIYIRELAEEIYRYNEDLLKNSEKQFTTEEIFAFSSMKDLKEELINRSVTKLIMSNYPNLVNKYESRFHIGIHSSKSPVTLFEVHHFLEVRNIIVHNEGHASKLFFERLKNYFELSPLNIKKPNDSPELNFEYLNKFKDKLIVLAEFIDNQAMQKWQTTKFEHKNNG